MPPFIKTVFDKATGFWSDRTVSQRILIVGLSLSVVLAFVLMVYWLNKPDLRVLYTRLYPEDAANVVSMLQGQKIPYEIQDNGQTILVPADQVYDLRLQVAGEGMLHGQGVGFEIFDDVQIGQTDFVQQINYQRALQGELARTISEFPQVDRARVHLVIPHRSLFIEDQIPPSASVVLKLAEGQSLEPEQVEGVVNLISMSVEGLERDRITVTDMQGQPLYFPEEDQNGLGLSTNQLDYKAQLERKYERRLEELLMPVVGPGAVIARVNADLDFSQRTIHRQTFDPNGQVVRSESREEQTTQGRAALDGAGVPDANFRGDGFVGTQTTQDSAREQRTTNFEINTEEQNIIAPVGELQRVSVAVIVDGTYQTNPDTGEVTYVPRTEEELARIKSLVQSAVGFDEIRGDQVEVTNISFGAPELLDDQGLMRTMLEYAQRLGKPFLNGLLIFLFLILVVRPVIMALIRPRVAEQEVEEVAGLPGSDRLALEEDEVDEEALDTSIRLENAKTQALQLSEENLDQAVRLLKTWIRQEA